MQVSCLPRGAATSDQPLLLLAGGLSAVAGARPCSRRECKAARPRPVREGGIHHSPFTMAAGRRVSHLWMHAGVCVGAGAGHGASSCCRFQAEIGPCRACLRSPRAILVGSWPMSTPGGPGESVTSRAVPRTSWRAWDRLSHSLSWRYPGGPWRPCQIPEGLPRAGYDSLDPREKQQQRTCRLMYFRQAQAVQGYKRCMSGHI